MLGALADNPIYLRERSRGGPAQMVVRILVGAYLALLYLACLIIPLVAGQYVGIAFGVLYYGVLVTSPLAASWIPPALVGATLAGESEGGTLVGIVLSPYPRRRVLAGLLAARLRVLLLFVLGLLPFFLSPLLFLGPLEKSVDQISGFLSTRTFSAPVAKVSEAEMSVLEAVPPVDEPLASRTGVRLGFVFFALWMTLFLFCEVIFAGAVSLLASLLTRSTAAGIALGYVGVIFVPCLFGMFLAPIGVLFALLSGPSGGTLSMQFSQQLIPQVLTFLFKLGIATGALLYAERQLDQWDIAG